MITTRRRFIEVVSIGMGGWALGCSSGTSSGTGQSAWDAATESGNQSANGGTGGSNSAGGTGSGGANSSPDSGGFVDASGNPIDAASNPGCIATTGDIEGPFYREGIPVRSNLDLYGEAGTKLQISGQVRDPLCVPIENAVVAIWAADTNGYYDSEAAELRYYGQVATDSDGRYLFDTIYPASYANRPSHVHLKVSRATTNLLTTQIYFAGDPLIADDTWAQNAGGRIITLTESSGVMRGVFNIDGMG